MRRRADIPSVHFVGAEGSGKTTIARLTAERYGLPLITEVVREELSRRETTLRVLRRDPTALEQFQRAVCARQIEAERTERATAPVYVSDRAIDNLAYAALYCGPGVAKDLLASAEVRAYCERLQHSAVFLVSAQRALLPDADDGVRETTWEAQLRTEGAIRMLLELAGIPWIPISCLAIPDRLRVIDGVLRVRGEP